MSFSRPLQSVMTSFGVSCAFTLLPVVPAPAQQDLLLHLTFDEGQPETVFNAAEVGRHAPVRAEGATAATGILGRALEWRGPGRLVTSLVPEPATHCTYAVWIRSRDGGRGKVIAQNRGAIAGGGQSLALYLSAGRVHWVLDGVSLQIGIASVGAVNDGQWHHVAALVRTTPGEEIKPINFAIYLDGREVPNAPVHVDPLGQKPTAPIPGKGPIVLMHDEVLAALGLNTTPLAGIDDFRYYARALEPSEIAGLSASATRPGAAPPAGQPQPAPEPPAPPLPVTPSPSAPPRPALPLGGSPTPGPRPAEPTIIPAPPAPEAPVAEIRFLAPPTVMRTEMFAVRVLVPPALRDKVRRYYYGGPGGLFVAGGSGKDSLLFSGRGDEVLQFVGPAGSAEETIGVRLYDERGELGGASARIRPTPVRLFGEPASGWKRVLSPPEDPGLHYEMPLTMVDDALGGGGKLDVMWRTDVVPEDGTVLSTLVERELGLPKEGVRVTQMSVAGFVGPVAVAAPKIGYSPTQYADLQKVIIEGGWIRGYVAKGRSVLGVAGSIQSGGDRRGVAPGPYSRDDTSRVQSLASNAMAQLQAILVSIRLGPVGD